jgi:hypothetical protein
VGNSDRPDRLRGQLQRIRPSFLLPQILAQNAIDDPRQAGEPHRFGQLNAGIDRRRRGNLAQVAQLVQPQMQNDAEI